MHYVQVYRATTRITVFDYSKLIRLVEVVKRHSLASRSVNDRAGFRDRLRKALKASGMTQEQLAEKVGASTGAVSDWINTGAIPRGEPMLRLPKALGVSADWLWTGAEPSTPAPRPAHPAEPGGPGVDDEPAELRRRLVEILDSERDDLTKMALMIDLALVLRADALRESTIAQRIEAETAARRQRDVAAERARLAEDQADRARALAEGRARATKPRPRRRAAEGAAGDRG